MTLFRSETINSFVSCQHNHPRKSASASDVKRLSLIPDVNKDLLKRLESLDQDPYVKGWLVKVQVSQEGSGLLTAKDYEKFISEE